MTGITDAATTGNNRAYGYDALGRLTTASGPWGSGSYEYDPLSNLRRKALGARTVIVQYNAQNQVSRMRDSRDGAYWVNYAHDERGNVSDRQNNVNAKALALSYDYANQPTAMTGSGDSGAIAGSFTYDGNLKRVKQTVNGKTIYSVYSRLGGGISFRDNITDGQEIDFLSLGAATLRLTDGGAPVYTHGDHLGSPVAATDAAGDILWREQYTPFGEKIIDPAANRDLSGYTGHIQDHASGLTYMQARYFDPVIGRFLSTDPIGYNDQMNLYAYVHNDPVNAIDPTGMETCIGSNMDKEGVCTSKGGFASSKYLDGLAERRRSQSSSGSGEVAEKATLCAGPCSVTNAELAPNGRPYSDTFTDAYLDYKNYSNTSRVWSIIGGTLGEKWKTNSEYYNSCASRVSCALNASGIEIPSISGQSEMTFGGPNNGTRFIIRDENLKSFISELWGSPDFANQSATTVQSQLVPGQAALFFGPGHTGVVTTDFIDKHTSRGDFWILGLRLD